MSSGLSSLASSKKEKALFQHVRRRTGCYPVYCDGFGPKEWVPDPNVTHVTIAGPFFHPTF
jgi:hypothetical protein